MFGWLSEGFVVLRSLPYSQTSSYSSCWHFLLILLHFFLLAGSQLQQETYLHEDPNQGFWADTAEMKCFQHVTMQGEWVYFHIQVTISSDENIATCICTIFTPTSHQSLTQSKQQQNTDIMLLTACASDSFLPVLRLWTCVFNLPSEETHLYLPLPAWRLSRAAETGRGTYGQMKRKVSNQYCVNLIAI